MTKFKVYRTSMGTEADQSGGYRFFATQREAKAAIEATPEIYSWQFGQRIEEFVLRLNTSDVIQFLNDVAGYPDNG